MHSYAGAVDATSAALVAEMRREMARLVGVMLDRNTVYLRREAELEAQYGDRPLVLKMRLADDYQLNKAGGTAKSCAVLVTALSTAIMAELAIHTADNTAHNTADNTADNISRQHRQSGG